MEFPAKEHFECYMHHKWRLNHKPRTLASSFTSVMLFLDFYGKSGKREIEKIERVDLEGFIEHEQDRGLRISTVRTRLACIIAFLHFLMEQEVISGSVLKRSIKLKLPEVLPRAMNPADVRKLLSVIDDIRDRALFSSAFTDRDTDRRGLRTEVKRPGHQGQKGSSLRRREEQHGRVVYLSDDALFALKLWLRRRNENKEFVFYGQSHGHLCYSTGRGLFVNYLKKAGLDQKGYAVHCLRHTFASELLNAGMRLECLQQLLGHQDIEVTRRYARLTDRTREEEYFRAMAIIEKGGIDGTY